MSFVYKKQKLALPALSRTRLLGRCWAAHRTRRGVKPRLGKGRKQSSPGSVAAMHVLSLAVFLVRGMLLFPVTVDSPGLVQRLCDYCGPSWLRPQLLIFHFAQHFRFIV